MRMSLKWITELVNIKTVNLDYLVENIMNELHTLLINCFNVKIRI
jgi:hypothetical protein